MHSYGISSNFITKHISNIGWSLLNSIKVRLPFRSVYTLPYWSGLILHVGRDVIFPGIMELEDYWDHDMKLSQWNILAIFIKRKKWMQSAFKGHNKMNRQAVQAQPQYWMLQFSDETTWFQNNTHFSFNYIYFTVHAYWLIFVFIFVSIFNYGPACCEPLYFISLHALCFFFDPPAVLKDFRSNIWWGAYRVIASYQWPTQCRAHLWINGPTRRIQWQGKDRAHSTPSLSLWLTDEMIQSLPFLFTCPCSFSVQPSWNSMLHYFTI